MSYIGVQKQGLLGTVIDKSECLVGYDPALCATSTSASPFSHCLQAVPHSFRYLGSNKSRPIGKNKSVFICTNMFPLVS